MRRMPVIEIIRLEEDDQGTFGVLRINKQVFCCTLELSDRLNASSISSIPAQQYYCNSFLSPTFGRTFRVDNVPGRDYILFHPGNTVKNTEGCILLGRSFGTLKEDRAILGSGDAFREFIGVLKNTAIFHLTIKECY